MKANFCICNNCGSVLLDENPLNNASVLDINEYLEMVQVEETTESGETCYFWACPNCLTDYYLSDMVSEANSEDVI